VKLSNHFRAASYSERKKWIAEKRKNRKFIFPVAAMKKIFKGFFMDQM